MQPLPTLWTRVDDRLIHGQVTVVWRQYLHFDRVWVVDDQVAADPFLRDTLCLAAPAGVTVGVHTVQQALKGLFGGLGEDLEGGPAGPPLLLLVKSPQAALALVEGGLPLDELNVGNLASRPGSKRAFASISLTPEQAAALDALAAHGVRIAFQPAPDGARATWSQVRARWASRSP